MDITLLLYKTVIDAHVAHDIAFIQSGSLTHMTWLFYNVVIDAHDMALIQSGH